MSCPEDKEITQECLTQPRGSFKAVSRGPRQGSEIQSRRGASKGKYLSVTGFERGEAKECERPLEADNGPQSTVSEEIGTSVLQQKGPEFCPQPE